MFAAENDDRSKERELSSSEKLAAFFAEKERTTEERLQRIQSKKAEARQIFQVMKKENEERILQQQRESAQRLRTIQQLALVQRRRLAGDADAA